MTALINLCLHLTYLCNSTSVQFPFEQLALPAPPVANGSSNPVPKPDPGINLLSWDDTPSTTENSLALVSVTDPLVDSTSNQNALAIVDIFSQSNTANSNANPADPFGLNSTPTLPGSQTYNIPTQHPLQSQQPPQQAALYPNEGAVNPGTSYGQASQFNHMTSGWNGQVANHVAPRPQQTLNYDDQSGALPPPPWEAQSVPSNEVSNGQLGGMQSHTTPMSQIGGMQPLQSQINNMGGPHTQPMYNNQPGAMLPQASQTAGTQVQPAGFGNQFGSLPQHSMPGMRFAGMQPPLMPVAQQVMMYPQQMPGVQFGARP